MYTTLIVVPGATEIEKWPFTSVTAPVLSPFSSLIEAPIIGIPFSSLTVPEMVWVCCCSLLTLYLLGAANELMGAKANNPAVKAIKRALL